MSECSGDEEAARRVLRAATLLCQRKHGILHTTIQVKSYAAMLLLPLLSAAAILGCRLLPLDVGTISWRLSSVADRCSHDIKKLLGRCTEEIIYLLLSEVHINWKQAYRTGGLLASDFYAPLCGLGLHLVFALFLLWSCYLRRVSAPDWLLHAAYP